MAMDPATAAGILQSDYPSGASGQADAVNLAVLRNQRLAELRRHLALDPTGSGGTSADAEQLQSDINTDPNTGLAAQQAAAESVKQGQAQSEFNSPGAASVRNQQQANAVQLAQAPGVQMGTNEQALEGLKAKNAIDVQTLKGKSALDVQNSRNILKAQADATKANTPPAQVQSQAIKANELLNAVPTVHASIDHLQKYIGAAGGRWSDFMAGTARSDEFADNPQDAHDLNQLRINLKALAAGAAGIHGRGGGANMALINNYEKDLNIASDPSLLHGAVDGFRDIFSMYAHPTPTGGGAQVAAPGPAAVVGTQASNGGAPGETPDARKARLIAALGAQ